MIFGEGGGVGNSEMNIGHDTRIDIEKYDCCIGRSSCSGGCTINSYQHTMNFIDEFVENIKTGQLPEINVGNLRNTDALVSAYIATQFEQTVIDNNEKADSAHVSELRGRLQKKLKSLSILRNRESNPINRIVQDYFFAMYEKPGLKVLLYHPDTKGWSIVRFVDKVGSLEEIEPSLQDDMDHAYFISLMDARDLIKTFNRGVDFQSLIVKCNTEWNTVNEDESPETRQERLFKIIREESGSAYNSTVSTFDIIPAYHILNSKSVKLRQLAVDYITSLDLKKHHRNKMDYARRHWKSCDHILFRAVVGTLIFMVALWIKSLG